MTTVLVTGFEPFGGERVNPSWQAASSLAARPSAAGVEVHAVQLPCVYGAAPAAMAAAVRRLDPDVVIGVGQAGGRYGVTPERIAVNLDDATAPDNAGNTPVDAPVVAGGPLAYRSGLPVKAVVAALRAAGIPAAVSDTAGTYVCNHVFYALMHLVATQRPGLVAGFVHVPFSTAQAAARTTPTPALPVPVITDALAVVLDTVLRHRADGAAGPDLAVPAGATA